LIVATGTKPNKLAFNVDKNLENRIFYEVYSVKNLENRHIAIIGSGDAAFDYALNLSKSNNVMILNRSDRIKALELLYKRCLSSKNVEYIDNIIVEDITESQNGLMLSTNKGEIHVDGLLAAIGRICDDTVLTGGLKDNPNLFMIGDIKNGILRQTAIAAGDGLHAAQAIHGRINNKADI